MTVESGWMLLWWWTWHPLPARRSLGTWPLPLLFEPSAKTEVGLVRVPGVTHADWDQQQPCARLFIRLCVNHQVLWWFRDEWANTCLPEERRITDRGGGAPWSPSGAGACPGGGLGAEPAGTGGPVLSAWWWRWTSFRRKEGGLWARTGVNGAGDESWRLVGWRKESSAFCF